MDELQGLLDSAYHFDTALARRCGLDPVDLRWFVVLAHAENGMTATELRQVSGLTAETLTEVLTRMTDSGHVRKVPGANGRFEVDPAMLQTLQKLYAPIDRAYVGLHRYSAEELGVVRTFLRVGRHFYERQAERLGRAPVTDPEHESR
jgi:hypothetical protein